MATESTTSTASTEETSAQEETGQQQATTEETSGNGEQQQTGTSTTQEPAKLPDDHPLVTTLNRLKSETAAQKTELTELRAKSKQVTQLEEDLKKRPTPEALETLQTRYDRLEAFLQAAGGPLGKALDSRSFTRDLFETDKDIEDLVKAWHRSNPTATSTALGSAGETGKAKVNPNDLLRAALGK